MIKLAENRYLIYNCNGIIATICKLDKEFCNEPDRENLNFPVYGIVFFKNEKNLSNEYFKNNYGDKNLSVKDKLVLLWQHWHLYKFDEDHVFANKRFSVYRPNEEIAKEFYLTVKTSLTKGKMQRFRPEYYQKRITPNGELRDAEPWEIQSVGCTFQCPLEDLARVLKNIKALENKNRAKQAELTRE